MKNVLVLFICLLLTINFALAQEDIDARDIEENEEVYVKDLGDQKVTKILEVTEEPRFMSAGEQTGFTVDIQGTTLKLAEDIWEKYMKQYKGKTKQDKKSGEYFSDDAEIEDLSSNTVDVYARFGETGANTVSTYVWFDLGGMYVGSENNPEKAIVAKSMLGEYARMVAKEEASIALDDQEKNLKTLNNDLKKLEKDKDNYLKKIEDAKKLIAEMEAEIKQNENEQAMKNKEISNQESVVGQAKGEVQKYN